MPAPVRQFLKRMIGQDLMEPTCTGNSAARSQRHDLAYRITPGRLDLLRKISADRASLGRAP